VLFLLLFLHRFLFHRFLFLTLLFLLLLAWILELLALARKILADVREIWAAPIRARIR
jgi:hypothetical protein